MLDSSFLSAGFDLLILPSLTEALCDWLRSTFSHGPGCESEPRPRTPLADSLWEEPSIKSYQRARLQTLHVWSDWCSLAAVGHRASSFFPLNEV